MAILVTSEWVIHTEQVHTYKPNSVNKENHEESFKNFLSWNPMKSWGMISLHEVFNLWNGISAPSVAARQWPFRRDALCCSMKWYLVDTNLWFLQPFKMKRNCMPPNHWFVVLFHHNSNTYNKNMRASTYQKVSYDYIGFCESRHKSAYVSYSDRHLRWSWLINLKFKISQAT